MKRSKGGSKRAERLQRITGKTPPAIAVSRDVKYAHRVEPAKFAVQEEESLVKHTYKLFQRAGRAYRWIAFIALLVPACGLGAGARFTKAVFGFNMNEVAKKVATLTERYHDVYVVGLEFSPDSSQIAMNADSGELDVWNWREGKILKTLEVPRGFNWGGAINPIQYSPDGRLLSVCEGKGAGHVVLRLWETRDWSIARDIVDTGPGGCQSAAFTPNGRFLLYVIDRIRSQELIAYSTDTWSLAWTAHLDTGPEAIAVSPDGHFAAVSGTTIVRQNTGQANSLATLRYEQTIDLVDLVGRRLVRTFYGDASGSVAWSPDSARLAVAGHGYVEMFEVPSGERIAHDALPKSAHMNLRFTPDGRYLIESDSNGRGTGLGVSIWNSKRAERLQRIPGNAATIAVSRDVKYLAVGGTGKTSIWQFR